MLDQMPVPADTRQEAGPFLNDVYGVLKMGDLIGVIHQRLGLWVLPLFCEALASESAAILRALACRRLLLFFRALFPREAIFKLLFDLGIIPHT